MTHGEDDPLICHGLHEGQGLGGGRANVIHATLLETTDGRTLIRGHEPSSASERTTDVTMAISAYLKMAKEE